jgi:hypothetical protein
MANLSGTTRDRLQWSTADDRRFQKTTLPENWQTNNLPRPALADNARQFAVAIPFAPSP